MRTNPHVERVPSVLVVDDTEEVAELYAAVLATSGYHVTTASDGRSGLGLASVLRPDLIILDMMMPELCGLEFLMLLKELPAAPPVIANSGYAAFAALSLARGATAFLMKPIAPQDLIATVERALDQRAPAVTNGGSRPPSP